MATSIWMTIGLAIGLAGASACSDGAVESMTHDVDGRVGSDGRCQFGRVVFEAGPDGDVDVQYQFAGVETMVLRTFSSPGQALTARVTATDEDACTETIVTGPADGSPPPADWTSHREEIYEAEVADGPPP